MSYVPAYPKKRSTAHPAASGSKLPFSADFRREDSMTFKTVNENCDKACYISRLMKIFRPTPWVRSGEHCRAATVVFQKP